MNTRNRSEQLGLSCAVETKMLERCASATRLAFALDGNAYFTPPRVTVRLRRVESACAS